MRQRIDGTLIFHWKDKRGLLGIIGDFMKLRLIANNGVTNIFFYFNLSWCDMFRETTVGTWELSSKTRKKQEWRAIASKLSGKLWDITSFFQTCFAKRPAY